MPVERECKMVKLSGDGSLKQMEHNNDKQKKKKRNMQHYFIVFLCGCLLCLPLKLLLDCFLCVAANCMELKLGTPGSEVATDLSPPRRDWTARAKPANLGGPRSATTTTSKLAKFQPNPWPNPFSSSSY